MPDQNENLQTIPADDQSLLATPGIQQEIRLPAGRELKQDPSAQRELILRTLPPGVGEDLAEAAAARDNRLTPLHYLGCLAALALAVFLLWRWFPRPAAPDELLRDVVADIQAPPLPRSSEFHQLEVQAAELHAQQEYVKCAELVGNSLEKLLDDDSGQYDRLLFLFLDSVHRGNVDPRSRLWQSAVTAVNTVANRHRDEIKWQIMRLSLNCAEFHDPAYFLRRLKAGQFQNSWQRLESGAKHTLSQLEPLISQQEQRLIQKSPTKEELDGLVALKIFQMKLMIGLWMLEGGKGEPDFIEMSDNAPGVLWREAACRVSREPDEPDSVLSRSGRQPREFLSLRLFIVETLLAETSFWQPCFWNGERLWKLDPLRKEQQVLRKSLKRR